MKIKDVKPGTTVTIKEGPAKGREVKVIATTGGNRVGIHANSEGQTVRGDLEVE